MSIDEVRRAMKAVREGAEGVEADRQRLADAAEDAAEELEATHRPDDDGRLCVTCGAVDGSWPCVARAVADDLRSALGADAP